MAQGIDPSSSTRIWENHLRGTQVAYARIFSPQEINAASANGLLILPSAIALTEAEKTAVQGWRNRGGSVLSTWKAGTHAATGEFLGYDFMQDALDVKVVGDTKAEKFVTFMVVHGDDPVANSLPAGTRIWMERLPDQPSLRLVGKREAAQAMNWGRDVEPKLAAGMIAYNERLMPSGQFSRVVTLAFPEQNWQRADPRQLRAVAGDAISWLLRKPRAYLAAWPHPRQSATLIALQAGEQVSEGEVGLARAVRDLGGRLTLYVHPENSRGSVELIKRIQSFGHELAFFGDAFEGFKSQPQPKQAQRFSVMAQKLRAMGLEFPERPGFAAPMDSYDETTVSVADERGFGSVVTFMEGTEDRLPYLARTPSKPTSSLVLLPRTLVGPEEAWANDPDLGLDGFLGGLELSDRMAALAVVRFPVQSLLMPDMRLRVVKKLQQVSKNSWIASSAQIARWWLERSQVEVASRSHPAGLTIGVSVRRAVTGAEPISIFLDLPRRSSAAELMAVAGVERQPSLKITEPGRAVITWISPPAGEHSLLVRIEP